MIHVRPQSHAQFYAHATHPSSHAAEHRIVDAHQRLHLGVGVVLAILAILLIPTTREYGLPLEARSSASRS
jgi:hypothetical protein